MVLFESPEPEPLRVIRTVHRHGEAMYTELEDRIERSMRAVWESSDPQAVFDEWGERGLQFAAWAAAVQDLLATVNPDYRRVTPDQFGYAYTIEDGRVVVSELENAGG